MKKRRAYIVSALVDLDQLLKRQPGNLPVIVTRRPGDPIGFAPIYATKRAARARFGKRFVLVRIEWTPEASS